MTFAITKTAAPLLNKPDNLENFSKDPQGRYLELETVLLPGSLVELVHQMGNSKFIQITTKEYPSITPLYVHSDLLKTEENPIQRKIDLPNIDTILHKLQALEGEHYVWGSNWPHEHSLNKEIKGFDCSGLLYYATDGYTPRNTSELISFGKEVCSPTLLPEKIQLHLKPLDLLVWKGHTLIVLSPETVIESRIQDGVIISSFVKRWQEINLIVESGKKQLFIRRWHPEYFQT